MRPLIVLAALFCAACQQAQPPADKPDADTIAANEAAPANAAAPTPAQTVMSEFPAAFLGRWGLVAGDCVKGASDNKGLMTVGARTLGFYESRGTTERLTISGEKASGKFAFTGEGQSWTHEVALTIATTEAGYTLTRNEDDLPTPLTYSKCPA